MEDNVTEFRESSNTDKLLQIAKDAPMLPIGLAAILGIVGHGIFTFRKRKMKPSLFIIHYRVAAQGTFLGCITLGLAYSMFKEHVWNKMKKD